MDVLPGIRQGGTAAGRGLLAAGVAAPSVLAVAVVLAGHFEPGNSHVSQYVSELGAVGAAHRMVFSIAGLFLSGLLTFLFALGLFLRVRPRPWLVASSLLVASAGLGRLTAGVFPCDPGCSLEGMSTSAAVHTAAGFVALTSGAVAPLLMAIGLRGRGPSPLLRPSVGLGGACLVLVILLFGLGKGLPFVGLVQRSCLAGFYSWVVAVVVRIDTLQHPAIDA